MQFTVKKQGNDEINPRIPPAEIINQSHMLPEVEATQNVARSCSMADGCISCSSSLILESICLNYAVQAGCLSEILKAAIQVLKTG